MTVATPRVMRKGERANPVGLDDGHAHGHFEQQRHPVCHRPGSPPMGPPSATRCRRRAHRRRSGARPEVLDEPQGQRQGERTQRRALRRARTRDVSVEAGRRFRHPNRLRQGRAAAGAILSVSGSSTTVAIPPYPDGMKGVGDSEFTHLIVISAPDPEGRATFLRKYGHDEVPPDPHGIGPFR